MRYSKKLDNYINTEEMADCYLKASRHEPYKKIEDLIWKRLNSHCKRASLDQRDKIFDELLKQLYSKYRIEVSVRVKKI